MEQGQETGDRGDFPPRPLEGLRLLAVEDHAIGRILLEAMLGPLGVDATIVPDGASAREAARAETFTVVLVDLGLPDIAGERLAGELAQLPGTCAAAFVAVTGRARPTELPAVFTDWLEKPFSVRELDARLRALTTPRVRTA